MDTYWLIDKVYAKDEDYSMDVRINSEELYAAEMQRDIPTGDVGEDDDDDDCGCVDNDEVMGYCY